jgi:hypothetical protein
MDSNILDELFLRIQQLESEVSSKSQKISELESKIEALTNPRQSEELNPKLSGPKAFVSNKLGFISSFQKGMMKIEFPSSLLRVPSDEPMLTRALSTNSYISQAISEIESISNKKKNIESEIEKFKAERYAQVERDLEAYRDSFTEVLSSSAEENNKLVESISNELKGSLILESATQKIFLFEGLNCETLQVSLSQIKDSNGLALKERKQVTESLFEFKKYRAIIKSEGEEIMSGLLKSTMNIYYQLIEIENNEKICCPVNITPEFLTLQDYEIKYNNSQSEITEVVNKNDGAVLFTTVVVSEDCGLLQTSMIEVFTSEVSEHILNIVHLHVDDMKDEIPLEAVYMLPDQNSSEYEDWSQDALGRNLRYKILVRSGQVDSILYNTGSTTERIHFVERRLKVGQLVAYNDSILQVLTVPYGLLTRDWLGAKSHCEELKSSKKPEGHCMSRYIEDLPGYVDVKTLIQEGSLSKNPKEFSIPACFLHPLTDQELLEVEMIFTKSKSEKENATQELMLKIQEMITGYNTMNIKSSRAFLNELTESVREAKEQMAGQVDLQEKFSSLISQSERIIRSVALDLRFNPS